MKRIEAVFLISVYGLVSVAALMLAFAEGAPFPQILTPPLAVVAYLLVDRSRKFHIPLWMANTLGVVAFSWAFYQMYDTTTEGRLLAGAHVVVYLTWIILFQDKKLTQYWWMVALAVPQVAVGAILTIASIYGGMLVAFMFAAIWTLSVFSLYQAQLQYGETGTGDELARSHVGTRMVAGSRAKGAALARSLYFRPSAARGTIQLDPDERWLGARYALSMFAVSTAALVVAAGFFLFIPRLWAGRNEWGSNETKNFRVAAMTGFTNEVRLGDMVPLLENPQRVLQVSLFTADGAPLDVAEYCASNHYAEPLFRGTTLELYDEATWSGARQSNRGAAVGRPRPDSVRQHFVMEPMGTDSLFAIAPFSAVRLANGETAEWHGLTGQIYRPEGMAVDKSITYDVYSGPPGLAFEDSLSGISADSRESYLDIDEAKLPRLVALARKLATFKGADKPKGRRQRDRRIIETLTAYLRDSGTYRYSLDVATQDAKIDPVEDFLINRKAGHCEYFASALALMLRAVDVPARMVSGFKGGSVNNLSGIYEVEQRHAHVWVEAFLQLDLPFLPTRAVEVQGRWVTIDPTPAARDASVKSFASKLGTAHDLASVVTSTWSRIMNLDINEQQTSFYTPLTNGVRNWWNPADGGERPYLAVFMQGLIDFATDPTQWFTLKGLLIATIIWSVTAGTILVVRMRGRIWQTLRSLWKGRSATIKTRIVFYERFEKVCSEMGLKRLTWQTQREFSRSVGPRIRELIASADGLPDFPPRLVEFFYRVRFGDEDLSHAVNEEIDRHLTSLEKALRNPQRRSDAAPVVPRPHPADA